MPMRTPCLRSKRLGRIWNDREPADLLEPFNALHRHALLEMEPPDHTRFAGSITTAFTRGHVERLRPGSSGSPTSSWTPSGRRGRWISSRTSPSTCR